MYRISVLNCETNGHVTSLVDGRRVPFFFIHHKSLAFGAHEDSIASVLNMFTSYSFRSVSRSGDGGFVHKIRKFGTGEARSASCDPFQIEFVLKFQVPSMNRQDCFAPANVCKIHGDLTIEATWTCQCFVENVRAI